MSRRPDEEETQAAEERATQAATGSAAATSVRRLGLALFLVSAAQFVLQLDFSIVNVALATIQREFGVAPADLQWIVTGYALPFGSLLLLGGRLGDMAGHRRLLVSGLALFAATSLGAGLAPTAGALIGFRFLQGASAALVAPMALAAVTDLFPEGPSRNRALGIFQGATAGGATAGIVLGGILTQYVGWRSIFLVNPPVIAVLVTAIMRLLPCDARGAHAARARLDVAGALLVTASVAALIYGLTHGQQDGFAAPATLATLGAAVILAVAFVVAERRVLAPMVPFAVLLDPGRRAALLAIFLLSSVVAGYVYFIALYMQRIPGFSALQAGLALVPATVMIMASSTFLTRRLLAWLGTRPVLAAGLVCAGLGQLWLARLPAPGTYAGSVLPGILLTAFGMSLVFPATSIAATARMGPGERGLAGGLYATSQQVGLAVGLAVLATVAAARARAVAASPAHVAQAGALAAGYRLSYLCGAGVVVATLALTMTLLRSRPSPQGTTQV